MKPFKVHKDVKSGGYHQFWETNPPVLIVTRFPLPKIVCRLIPKTKVHPPGKFVEETYRIS